MYILYHCLPVNVFVSSTILSKVIMFFMVLFSAAITCPNLDSQLSEHVIWRPVTGSLNEYGSQVLLSCSPGYYLSGLRLLQCRADGTWSEGNTKSSCMGMD